MSKKKQNTTTTSSTADSLPSPERQNDVCCICLDELPNDSSTLVRFTCCGKTCHSVCQKNVSKSTMPDELKYRCHQCRKPAPKNVKEQIERLREWLDKGTAWAQKMMGHWYRDGNCGLKQSYVMAAMLFEKAVAQGHPEAMYDLARLYEIGRGVEQSFEKTVELYTMAAEQGNVNAMCGLGAMYLQGKGVAQSNELARDWLTKAAKQGQEENVIDLLRLLDIEEVHQQDLQEGKPPTNAVELYTLAAEQGSVRVRTIAMFNLGVLYMRGQGVAKSYELAREWLAKAAQKGNEDAMVNLGAMYIQGQGVAQSYELAREWLTKAAHEGHEVAIKAIKLLDELEGKPTTAPPTTTAPPSPICCSSCHNPQPHGQRFQKCTGCRTVQYCNTDCQRAHWSPGGHKQECKRLKKKKEKKKKSSSQNKKSK